MEILFGHYIMYSSCTHGTKTSVKNKSVSPLYLKERKGKALGLSTNK